MKTCWPIRRRRESGGWSLGAPPPPGSCFPSAPQFGAVWLTADGLQQTSVSAALHHTLPAAPNTSLRRPCELCEHASSLICIPLCFLLHLFCVFGLRPRLNSCFYTEGLFCFLMTDLKSLLHASCGNSAQSRVMTESRLRLLRVTRKWLNVIGQLPSRHPAFNPAAMREWRCDKSCRWDSPHFTLIQVSTGERTQAGSCRRWLAAYKQPQTAPCLDSQKWKVFHFNINKRLPSLPDEFSSSSEPLDKSKLRQPPKFRRFLQQCWLAGS